MTTSFDKKDGKWQLTFDKPKIKGITFSGGGPKGIAYAGVGESLEQKGVLKGLERVSGASAGAMNAMLVAIGMDSEDIRAHLENAQLSKLIKLNLETDGLKQKFQAGVDFVKNPHRDDGKSLRLLMDTFVVKQMQKLMPSEESVTDKAKWVKLQDKIENAINNMNKNEEPLLTFADLHTLRELLPEADKHKIKDLYINATNKTTGESVEYSWKKTPEMPIALAAQISGAHPVMFRPYKNEMGEKLADGGIMNNMPVQLLERESDPNPYNKHGFSLNNVCFMLGGTAEHQKQLDLLNGAPKILAKIEKKLNYLLDNPSIAQNLIGGNFVRTGQKDAETAQQLASMVIPLDTGDITTYTLNPTDTDIKQAIDNAKAATDNFIDAFNANPTVTYTFETPTEMVLKLTEEHFAQFKTNIKYMDPKERAEFKSALDLRKQEDKIVDAVTNNDMSIEEKSLKIKDLTNYIAEKSGRNIDVMKAVQDRLDRKTGGEYQKFLPQDRAEDNNAVINYSSLAQKINNKIDKLKEIKEEYRPIHKPTTEDKKIIENLIEALHKVKNNQPIDVEFLHQSCNTASHFNKKYFTELVADFKEIKESLKNSNKTEEKQNQGLSANRGFQQQFSTGGVLAKQNILKQQNIKNDLVIHKQEEAKKANEEENPEQASTNSM